ncbi:MAG: hypothetical protein GY765_37020 [bacterium]|nr:hypothetical protein [bacterium]
MRTDAEFRDSVLVVVLAGGEGSRLMPLTKTRTKPAVPIGAKYRLIDIPLSNAANSGLHKSLVLTQGMDKSLNRHIKNTWYSDRQHGAFTEVISPQGVGKAYQGDADAVRQVLGDINEVKPKIVLVVPGDHLLKMNYFKFVKFLAESDADAAISIIQKPLDQAGRLGSLQLGDNDNITAFKEKDPNTPFAFTDESNRQVFFASMGIYAFRRKALLKSLKLKGDLFGKDIIPKMLSSMTILGYNYNKRNIIMDRNWIHFNGMVIDDEERSSDSDYWRDVGTIGEYFNAHMDLTGITPIFNLYGEKWPFFTGKNVLGPAKIIRTEDNDKIESALIGEGSFLSNVKARSLVVSPRVYIDRSSLHNVIVFEGSNIQKCNIKNTIIDKRVCLMNMTIGFDEEEDRRRGIYIDPDTGIRVIPKGYDYTYPWFDGKLEEFNER